MHSKIFCETENSIMKQNVKFPNILYDSFVNLIADYTQKFSFSPINVGKKPPLPAFFTSNFTKRWNWRRKLSEF